MPNPGFTLAEDAALKERLKYMRVSDDRNARRDVSVFFRYPEGETEKLYPFVTIELLDITYAANRQHSDVNYYYTNNPLVTSTPNAVNYYPSEYDEDGLSQLAGDTGYIAMDQFVPVDLMYQVVTHCRSQRHDRELTAYMLRYVFPMRRGFIEIPEDGTVRRCTLLDWRNLDLLDQESGYRKRIFRKVYTVTISAEIPQSNISEVFAVSEVNGTLTDNNTDSPTLTPTFSEEF